MKGHEKESIHPISLSPNKSSLEEVCPIQNTPVQPDCASREDLDSA